MSSLRISQQSRAVGESVSVGEASRADASGDSFAFALGAAGLARQDSGTLPSGTAGDTPESGIASRKPGDGQRKAAEVAAVLAAQGSLVAAAAGLPAAPPTGGSAVPNGGRSTTDDSGATPPVAGMAHGPIGSGETAAALTAQADLPVAATAVAAPSLEPTQAGLSVAATAGAVPTLEPTPASPSASRAPVKTDLGPTVSLVVREASPVRDASSATAPAAADAAPSPGSAQVHPRPLVAAPHTASTSPPTGVASANEGVPGDPASAVPVGSADGASILGRNQAGPAKPGAAQALPALFAGLPQNLPTAPGQAGTGDTPFGDAGRGRDTSVAGASVGGDATAATALSGSGEAAALGTAPTAASAMTPDPTVAATLPDQVAGQLVRLVSGGGREMVMRLHPPELGDLTVRVVVSGRDVAAWFASPQPQVQTAISAALGQLQADLGNAGYNLSGAWVGGDAAGARQQSASPPPPTASVAAAMPALGLSGVAASRPAASGVNIYV